MNDRREQELCSRIDGLMSIIGKAFDRLAVLNPDKARAEIEQMCDAAIDEFKNSDIPAEFEMRHAEIVRPAIDAIELVRRIALRKFDKG